MTKWTSINTCTVRKGTMIDYICIINVFPLFHARLTPHMDLGHTVNYSYSRISNTLLHTDSMLTCSLSATSCKWACVLSMKSDKMTLQRCTSAVFVVTSSLFQPCFLTSTSKLEASPSNWPNSTVFSVTYSLNSYAKIRLSQPLHAAMYTMKYSYWWWRTVVAQMEVLNGSCNTYRKYKQDTH